MPTATEHGLVVLASIIPNRVDRLDAALRHLTPLHFMDPEQSGMFSLLERYADVTGAVMTSSACEDLLSKSSVDAGRQLLYKELYSACALKDVEDSDFRWSLQELRELAATAAVGEMLTDAMEILRQGKTVGRQDLRGQADARTFVLTRIAEVDAQLMMQDAPEGDMRLEGTQMKEDYAERKRLRTTNRVPEVMFGLPELDARTGGLHPGELDLVLAFAGEGKTTLCSQLAWNASVVQGRNVFVATSETVRDQVRRKIVSRHSRASIFGLPSGLNSAQIKAGNLDPSEESSLAAVIDDLTSNSSYGKLHIAQVPRGATLSTVESRMTRQARLWHIDLVIIDYLALLKSDRRRAERRDELGETVRDAKVLATTFDDGRGVPIVSPWQTNRTSYEEALRHGHYTLRALSETAEAEKSADIVISLLKMADAPQGRQTELKAQILKNRDGETLDALSLTADYATSMVEEVRRSSAMDDMLEP